MADVVEVNAATGDTIERDFTPEERAQRDADQLAYETAQAEQAAAAEERAAARAALLARLKITEEEARLLIEGP